MKKFIMLNMFSLLFSMPSFAIQVCHDVDDQKDTAFVFRQCVRVVHGFYRGCKGVVTSFDDVDNGKYAVESDDCRGANFVSDFYSYDLEACQVKP